MKYSKITLLALACILVFVPAYPQQRKRTTNGKSPSDAVNSGALLRQKKNEHSGLFPVLIAHRMGYIDAKGNIVINPQFDLASQFSEGFAAIKIGDKYGYINKAGQIVINPLFDVAFSFSEGLAMVQVGDKFGYIDESGRYIVKPQFTTAAPFSEGLAVVKIGGEYAQISSRAEIG